MKHKIKGLICCVFLITALAGCQLAQEDIGAGEQEDRLIGVFVTVEHLERLEEWARLEGRVYAERVIKEPDASASGGTAQVEEYVFPDLKGISFFSPTISAAKEGDNYVLTVSDPAVNDVRMSLNVGDETEHRVLEGMIYAVLEKEYPIYQFNPVYQSADGRVYATAGSSVSNSTEIEGTALSQTLDDSVTTTVNGKSSTVSTSVKLSISTMLPPQKIVLLQMSEGGNLLSRMEYEPGALPEFILPEPETAYFVAETYKQGLKNEQTVAREIFGKDCEHIGTFSVREDGICVRELTPIRWPK